MDKSSSTTSSGYWRRARPHRRPRTPADRCHGVARRGPRTGGKHHIERVLAPCATAQAAKGVEFTGGHGVARRGPWTGGKHHADDSVLEAA